MTREREAEIISFEVVTTLDDQIALQRYLTAALRKKGSIARIVLKRRFSLRFWPMFAVFFGLTFIGVLTNDEHGGTLKALFGGSSGWKLAVQFSIIVLMFWLLPGLAIRWWTRRRVRAVHAALYRGRPDVEPGDRAMSVRRRIRFDDDGFNVSTAIFDHWESWRRITGLDETPTLLILRVGRSIGYAFPKRDLTAELQERLHLYVVQRYASKWPF